MTTTGCSDGPDDPAPWNAGAVVGSRYRLIERFDGPRGSQFWLAHDIRLRRDVSVDVIEPRTIAPAGAEALRRYSRDTSGTGDGRESHVARVYDIIEILGSEGGDRVAVIAEWIPGRTLAEVAAAGPAAREAARAVRALAADTSASHRHGHHLPLDHPGRVRVALDRSLVLAYPSTPATATDEADVVGLGAILYALLTGAWPLDGSESSYAGLPPAARDREGQVLAPALVRPDIDPELSALTVSALGPRGSGMSADTLVAALDGWLAAHPHEQQSPATPDAPGPVGAVAVGAALVVGLGVAGWGVGAWAVSSDAPLVAVGEPASIAEPFPSATVPQDDAFAPTGATVVVLGRGDGAGEDAGAAVDGDPSTAWSTDRRPSPYPDEDIGLVVTLPVLAEVGDVWIDSLSPGATVEIRTVPDRSGRLDSTRILGTGTIEAGVTRIAVATPDPTDRLLVRLTGLAPVDGGYQTSLSEIGFTGKR